jgi:hypothetical protein
MSAVGGIHGDGYLDVLISGINGGKAAWFENMRGTATYGAVADTKNTKRP